MLRSKTLTQSTTPKNPSKALPNINNSACASTSRAESIPIDSAINAEQKSNEICSAAAHTDTRPLRGAQSLEQGGRSASATIALEAEKARLSPCLRKKSQRVASKAPKKPPLFAQPQSISFGGRASLLPCLVKNAKNALLHFLNAFF